MGANIGPKIGIDGEAEYRKQLNNIIQQAKTLDSEMKALASSFDSSTSAQDRAAKTTEVLQKQIANQQTRVEALSQAVAASAEHYGENATETLKWKEALNTAQAELNGMNSDLEHVNDNMEEGAENASTFGDVLKANLTSEAIISGVKALASAMAEVGKAALEFGKEVVNSYADYEQLVGGMQKLFSDDYTKVIENAGNAFKTAGLSANEYMETVTSFSASLINSLGGDTEKAAELADKAIQDMSDNANTFGTDMSSIQAAYINFSKQQYQMLDTLSLGYAGTKEGMQDLLNHANELNAAQGKYTNYSIENFSDIVEAIHLVQEEMNIAGTTANEAEGTISGSIAMLKSSFSNFVTGLGSETADVDKLLGDVIDSFNLVVKNVQPVVERLVGYLPDIATAAIEAIGDMLPELLKAIEELMSEGIFAILEFLPEVADTAVEVIMMLVNTLVDNIDKVIDVAVEIIFALINGIIDALPTLIEKIPIIIVQIVSALVSNLPKIYETGVNLIGMFIEGIISYYSGLVQAGGMIIEKVHDGIKNLISGAAQWGKDLITNFISGIMSKISNLISSVKNVAATIRSYLHFSEPDKGPLSDFSTYAPDMMKTFADGITKNKGLVTDAVANAFNLQPQITTASAGASAINYGGFNIVVNGAQGQNVNDIAEAVMERIETAVGMKGAVFA